MMLKEINSMNVGTSLFNVPTNITSYADDIILLSSTLTGLQKMVNKCVQYGYQHGIKFNPKKTKFIVSGPIHFNNLSLSIDGHTVTKHVELKHLGFHWQTNSMTSVSSIDVSHTDRRIADFWAATKALVSSGIRFLHPHSIAELHNTLLIPKLAYGLELCHITPNLYEHLEKQSRLALKSSFNLSKYARNLLHPTLKIKSMKDILQQRKLTLFTRLLQNNTTKSILCRQMSNPITPRCFLSDIIEICNDRDINLIEMFLSSKVKPFVTSYDLSEEQKIKVETIKQKFRGWFIPENRFEFKRMMEDNIIR